METIRRQVPLAEVPRFLNHDLPEAVLRAAPAGLSEPVPADAQFAALIARADGFANAGSPDLSVGLREAALLLRPGDVGQRRRLVDEYFAAYSARPDTLPPTQKAAERRSAHRRELWELGLQHLEYLIRNGLITRREAIVTTGRYR